MTKLFQLPQTATAPFCPSEVKGSIQIDSQQSFFSQIKKFLGPGLLVSIGYMDPGNWATDIAAGSKFGYQLLFMVLFSSFAAMLLQYLSLKLGIVSEADLAQNIKKNYSPKANFFSWIFAEIAMIATDLAEVLGSALAIKLLFGLDLTYGILITALDSLIVLGLKGKGFRQIEAIMLGLVSTIGICFFVQLYVVKPELTEVLSHIIPSQSTLLNSEAIFLAIGILGATVMPHNLYLHSSIVNTRKIDSHKASKKAAIKFSAIDSTASLLIALIVNASILILAAKTFNQNGHHHVTEIDQAYQMLTPLVGSFASVLFGVGLLAAGQSSTLTGTIAGQVVMDGHMEFKIPCWKRRLITRSLALLPALIGVSILGENSTGRLLVLSQVVLSLQLPFALYPLIKFTSNRSIMSEFTNGRLTQIISWFLFMSISLANVWLIYSLFNSGFSSVPLG